MLTNRVFEVIRGLLSVVIIPTMAVTTFVVGLAVNATFGLLLIPMSVVWAILSALLLAASWCCGKSTLIRESVGLLLTPLAVSAWIYAVLMPSMGERENRAWKLMLCESWPFCWEFWLFSSNKLMYWMPGVSEIFLITKRMSTDPLKDKVLFYIENGGLEYLDGGCS